MIPKDLAFGSRLWILDGDDGDGDVVEAVLDWRSPSYLDVTYPEGGGRYGGLPLERAFVSKREALLQLRFNIEEKRKRILDLDRVLRNRANEVLERINAMDRAEREAKA